MSEFDDTTVEVGAPRVDEAVAPGLTVRRGHPLGAELFAQGTRVGFYKTEAGLARAIERHRLGAVVESYPYDRPDAARRHAVEIGGVVNRNDAVDGGAWDVHAPREGV